jgi:hypothetical protein
MPAKLHANLERLALHNVNFELFLVGILLFFYTCICSCCLSAVTAYIMGMKHFLECDNTRFIIFLEAVH